MRSPSSIEKSAPKAPWLEWLQKHRGRIRILLYFSLILYVYLEVRHLRWQPAAEANSEMEPLIHPGDAALLYKKSAADYKPGDVIYVKAPGAELGRFMEVIAADGGLVKISAGKLSVDGVEKTSPSLPAHLNRSYPELRPGQLFCVCNNQATDARDSILEGAIKKDSSILGKVFYLRQVHKPDSP